MSVQDDKNIADAFGRICTCEHRARKHGSCGCSEGREIGEQGYAVYPCPCLWTGLVQDDGVRFRTEVAALRKQLADTREEFDAYRNRTASVTVLQQKLAETKMDAARTEAWLIERIDAELVREGLPQLSWTDGGGSDCPTGWHRNPYLNSGIVERLLGLMRKSHPGCPDNPCPAEYPYCERLAADAANEQKRAALEAENARLREALAKLEVWGEEEYQERNNGSFLTGRWVRDIARGALAASEQKRAALEVENVKLKLDREQADALRERVQRECSDSEANRARVILYNAGVGPTDGAGVVETARRAAADLAELEADVMFWRQQVADAAEAHYESHSSDLGSILEDAHRRLSTPTSTEALEKLCFEVGKKVLEAEQDRVYKIYTESSSFGFKEPDDVDINKIIKQILGKKAE